MAKGLFTEEDVKTETSELLVRVIKAMWEGKDQQIPSRKAGTESDFQLIIAEIAGRLGVKLT